VRYRGVNISEDLSIRISLLLQNPGKRPNFLRFVSGPFFKPVEMFVAMNKNMNKNKIAQNFLYSMPARKSINRKLACCGKPYVIKLRYFSHKVIKVASNVFRPDAQRFQCM
jgi:hypothetical protein